MSSISPDGTASGIVYDPATGAVGAVFTNVQTNGNGQVYTPGKDAKMGSLREPVHRRVNDITSPTTSSPPPSGAEIATRVFRGDGFVALAKSPLSG